MSLDFELRREGKWLDTNEKFTNVVFECNITHNLNTMADACGVYKCLWRPDEQGYKVAGDIIADLENGLKKLKDNPEHYKKYNPSNGWGDYDWLVDAVESTLEACKKFPHAVIKISR